MLDPITSLLAACTNCDQPSTRVDQPGIAVCDTDQRSHQNRSQSPALIMGCISPPETTSAALRLSPQTVEVSATASQAAALIPASTPTALSPESVILVSWSNAPASDVSTANTLFNPAANPTSNLLSPATAGTSENRVLQFGNREQAVSRLQTQLKRLGYYKGAVDGIYGQLTQRAVAQFQRSKGLQADGMVGSQTWAALQSASRQAQAAKPPAAPAQADRPASQTVQSATPASQKTSPDLKIFSQFPLTYLWIVGWWVIYMGGWIFILKDTTKELKGFHFFEIVGQKKFQATAKPAAAQPAKAKQQDSQATPKVVVHYPEPSQHAEPSQPSEPLQSSEPLQYAEVLSHPAPIEPHPEEARVSSGDERIELPHPAPELPSFQPFFYTETIHASKQSSSNSSHPLKTEQVALADPWQEEKTEAIPAQMQVTLANDGQVQPIQNVFVIVPRSIVKDRSQAKKPTSIHKARKPLPRIKTG